jgi:hypothetical protein
MIPEYYKKVDRSMMDWGLTIPKKFWDIFQAGNPVKLGTSREVTITWEKKRYLAKLCHVNRTQYNPVYQLRWDSNKELLKKIRKTFIQSYVILKSQKELFDISKKERKHFRTNMDSGKQEVIIIKPKDSNNIEFEVFIKIEDEWNTLFERLAEENVFGWIFDKKDKQYLIQRSTNWIKVKDFPKHANALNVIYYLINTNKKLIYIGKAENLGKRVKPGRKHQNMDGDWDLFKYDIIRPEFTNILERIEDHTIRSFAAVLKNQKSYPSINISNFTLVNSNWKKL